MDESVFIEAITDGDEFVGYYALKRCELKETDGLFRLELELSDKTGSLPAVVWNDARELKEQMGKGFEKIRPAEEGEYDPDSFLKSTPKNIDDLKAQIESFIGSLSDPFIKELADSIFGKAKFMEEFTRSPGGKRWHHPYLGGLLEHTVGVTGLCDFAAGQHPELNRDLLIIAALLHDVGKIREFTVSTIIDYSDEGRLEGHIVMGERFVRNMCDRIDNFPQKTKMLLSHLILSHQGQKAFSSPVEPMIPEGFVLYYADEIDSKLNALRRISERTADEGSTWSEYIKLLGRMIYVGDE